MSRIFHPLLYILVSATRQELARQVNYLKTENQILRSKLPKRVLVTATERRQLVKAARGLGLGGYCPLRLIHVDAYRISVASQQYIPRHQTAWLWWACFGVNCGPGLAHFGKAPHLA